MTPKQFADKNRTSPGHLIAYARRHPDRIVPFLKRTTRDLTLRIRAGGDHVAYYRAVMESDVASRSAHSAVGSPNLARWNAVGRLQVDYLRSHGLQPGWRMLEIGCGNLRAGRHFIEFLDPGNHHGIDISPAIMLAARRTVAQQGLQTKLPHLTLVDDLRFTHLLDGCFDVVHAHSVFSHSPLEVIEECFAHVARVMAPGAFFDFTYDRTMGREHQVLHEDFYYRTDTLVEMAARHHLHAEPMEDWEEMPHRTRDGES